MSGRPHYYDTAMEATISTKISQEENEELNRLVRVSGVSKSDIIRSALTIILKHVRESGKNLRRFYGRNWRTLFAPVPEHRMPGITKGE